MMKQAQQMVEQLIMMMMNKVNMLSNIAVIRNEVDLVVTNNDGGEQVSEHSAW